MRKASTIAVLLFVAVGCSSTATPTAKTKQQNVSDESNALPTADSFARGKDPLVELTFGAEAGTYPDKMNSQDTVHVCHVTVSQVLAGAANVGDKVLTVCSVDNRSGDSGFVVGAAPPKVGDVETVILAGPPMTDVLGGQPVYGIFPANTAGAGGAVRATSSPFDANTKPLDVDPATYAHDLTTTSTIGG